MKFILKYSWIFVVLFFLFYLNRFYFSTSIICALVFGGVVLVILKLCFDERDYLRNVGQKTYEIIERDDTDKAFDSEEPFKKWFTKN